jgi:hypothetical protein
MSECRHLKPCQYIGHRGKICGKTPTSKITITVFDEHDVRRATTITKYVCMDHGAGVPSGRFSTGNYTVGVDWAGGSDRSVTFTYEDLELTKRLLK